MYAQILPSYKSKYHPINMIISILVLVMIIIIPFHDAQEYNEVYYSTCRYKKSFVCGNKTLKMVYPFWGGDRPQYCGLDGFELSCFQNDTPYISIGEGSTFRVLEIDPATSGLILERYDFEPMSCPGLRSTIPYEDLYSYGMGGTVDLYLYLCDSDILKNIPPTFGVRNSYTCSSNTSVYNSTTGTYEMVNRVIFGLDLFLQSYNETLSSACYNGWTTRIPVDRNVVEEFANDEKLQPEALYKPSFKIQYLINTSACSDCERSGGECWSYTDSPYLQCLYQPSGKASHLKLWIGIGAAALFGILLLLVFFICYRRMKNRDSAASYPKDVEAFIQKYGSSIPKRYRYTTLKKMTNSFKDELGKGGYGNVYKGRLSDGCLVAVKVLHETKGNGEEFMNEVASIGRTSHVNVVTLLGFVYEGNKRALIYEFMPNGSLEKFIYNTTQEQNLSWEKLYTIALGIARGLEYLHCGCTTQILHLDIKPHNILLDEDFSPKISDFGLAKLHIRKESAVSSSMQARGTIGFIAPEVFSRYIGQVTDKSDVYSYGMMILEMVGGRKNVDTRAARSSEVYFPSWVYNHIEVNQELSSADNMSEGGNHISRKMMLIGLWCIQTNPSQRPSISKVIEMFEGSLAALEIPPKPYLCSPPTSPSDTHQKILSSSSNQNE